MTTEQTAGAAVDEVLRQEAVKQLKKRRDFHTHLLVYVLVNAFLVAIWWVAGWHGFFWPIFPIVGWGIGVALNAWDVYRGDTFTEADIQREIARLRR